MGRFFEHSDIEQKVVERVGDLNPLDAGLDPEQSQVDTMREKMKEKYGWLSPSEYYSGQYDSSPSTSTLGISLDDIENFRKSNGEVIEEADRNTVPNYFWVDSIRNWCYFKITDDMTAFKKTSSRFGKAGNALLNIAFFGVPAAIDAAQNGHWWNFFTSWVPNLVLSYSDLATESIEGMLNIERFVYRNLSKFEEYLFGTNVLSSVGSRINTWQLTLGSMMLGASNDLMHLGKTALPGVLWTWISASYDLGNADVDTESYIEELATGNKLHNMPRNCISLYMWNGYKRAWMPVKQLFEVYDRYCKRSSYDLVYCTVKDFYEDLIASDEVLDKFLETIGLPNASGDAAIDAYRANAKWIKTNYGYSESKFCELFTKLVMQIPQCINYCSRFLFINIYGIDPACIEAIQFRSPLSKKQTLYNWTEDNSSWTQKRWLENMSFWIPLPNDSAKIKLYLKDTFQLINRPTAYRDWFTRDLKGYMHKNIGHPCFMRGNDDVLWMCYWLRWTSTRGEKEEGGSLLSKTVTIEGMQDIMKEDVENWESIVSSMFERHDEYGFEDWLINGNYLLSYSKFTIDEEQPSDILTFEDSSLAPNKIEPVNSVDEFDESVMTLSLSSGTVVSRDDGNEYVDTAKRWR